MEIPCACVILGIAGALLTDPDSFQLWLSTPDKHSDTDRLDTASLCGAMAGMCANFKWCLPLTEQTETISCSACQVSGAGGRSDLCDCSCTNFCHQYSPRLGSSSSMDAKSSDLLKVKSKTPPSRMEDRALMPLEVGCRWPLQVKQGTSNTAAVRVVRLNPCYTVRCIYLGDDISMQSFLRHETFES